MSNQNQPEFYPRRRSPNPIIEPNDVSDYYGLPCARWGQCVIPEGEERDPIPAVYVSGHRGGEVDLDELRLNLDEAEKYAARILNAVRYQQRELDKQVAAELNEMARGTAITHDWQRPHGETVSCTRCRCTVYRPEDLLAAGSVPPCQRGGCCSFSSAHAVGGLPRTAEEIKAGVPCEGQCIYCKTVYPATAGIDQETVDTSTPGGATP